MKKKHVTHEAESPPNKDPFMTCQHSSRVQGPGGLEHQWGPSWTGCCASLIYKYQLASLHLNITSNTGVVFIYQFILSCLDSTVAARGMYVYGHWVCSDSWKVHRVSWQAMRLRLFFHLIVLLLPARAATCRRKVLLISKAGYLPRIQLSSGFQPIWPEGTSVPLIELTPASHQGLIKRWRW